MFAPIDLEAKEFKKVAFGGYDKEEIDNFMAALFQDYQSLYMENISLKDKINTLSSAVTKYKSMEDVLQNTLIVAQTTSDELKKSANDKAGIIVDEAEVKAREIVMNAQEKANEAKLELKNAKLQMINYKRQMLNQLQNIQELISNIPEESERDGN